MQGNEPEVSVREQELLNAKDLADQGLWQEAYDIVYTWLKSDPNDPQALNLIGYILLNTEKAAVAYPILKQLTQIAPEYSIGWLNFGMAASDLWRYSEAKRAYKKGIMYAATDAQKSKQCVNMASCMVDHGDFEAAEPYCDEAIRLNPDTIKGKANLGFCQLAQRKWVPGWENYRYCIGSTSRPLIQYNDEPLWEGQKGTICVYSEQGLGDEISFGQMLPDMQRWCDENDSKLIVDVNPRLEGLFQRSFPGMVIHGTRGIQHITWDPRDIEFSLPMAQLGEYFRTKDSDFTGEPYLTADPDRVIQWKALFESKGKPVIGLAWMSGIWKTAAKYRFMDLETMYPLMASMDAHWVSLQYKPAGKQIAEFKERHPDIDIVEYPHGTLTQDYDDTIAMIAAMDRVVALQTTAIHVAGGLGVPCDVLVPQTSQWRYGQGHENFLWAKSVRIVRQTVRGEWDDVIERLTKEVPEAVKRANDEISRKPTHKANGRGTVLEESRP